MNWQKERFSQKQLTSESFDNDNKLTLKSFFAFYSVFFLQGQTKERWKRLRQTMLGFQNTQVLHLRAKTYSALSYDRINFFNVANLFLLSRKAFVMCYCFCAPIKTFLFEACQIVHPVLVSGPANRKKPYNKHLISLVFSVRTVNYGSSFFSIDLWPKRKNSANKKYLLFCNQSLCWQGLSLELNCLIAQMRLS